MKGRIYPAKGGGHIVRFGREVSKWFKTLAAAERFLTGLRYETDKGTFDIRDYAPGRPMAVENLVAQYLKAKQRQVKPSIQTTKGI